MIDFNRGRVFYLCVTSKDHQFLLYFKSRAEKIGAYFILSTEINAYQKQIKVISITSEMI